MRLPRLWRRWLGPAALLPVLLLTSGPTAHAGTIQLPWPGLPAVAVPAGMTPSLIVGSQGNGLTEVTRARQWIKIPAQAVLAATVNGPTIYFPAGDPEGRDWTYTSYISVFLSSPAGAKDGYGIGLPVTVHTVAFGSIPIQARMQLEQLRDGDDLPVPLQLSIPATEYLAPGHEVRPGVFSQLETGATISGKVRVRLTALSVDGVDVGLGDCLSAPIELALKGNPWWQGDPLTDQHLQPFVPGSAESSSWLAARGEGTVIGGGVSGEIDIPAFSHCLTKAGEDLSPLLTGAVSGPGNAVTVGYATIASTSADHLCDTPVPYPPFFAPRGPFLGDPSDCDPTWGPPTLDYPARRD